MAVEIEAFCKKYVSKIIYAQYNTQITEIISNKTQLVCICIPNYAQRKKENSQKLATKKTIYNTT